MADTVTEKKARPEKPNEEEFQASLAKLQKEHKSMMDQLNAVKAKLDLTKGNNKDSTTQTPTQQRQSALRSELNTIKTTQSSKKSSKNQLFERQKTLNDSINTKIANQKAAKSKVPYKSTDEIDNQIKKLEKDVDSGMLKLVDERKTLTEISNLKKLKKNFAGFDEMQESIDKDRAALQDLRKQMDDPEAKALSDRFTEITKELDEIKAEQDSVYQNLNGLRDERTKLQNQQQEKFQEIKTLKDNYYQSKSAYRDFEQEQWKSRQEKRKTERDAYEKEKKMKHANQLLEDASLKAYTSEIMTCEGLINYFDPSNASKKTDGPVSKYAAQVGRSVSEEPKGMKVLKKDEEDYFIGGSGKGKKGKKGGQQAGTATPTAGKFSLSMGVLEEFGKVDVHPPMAQDEVPAVLEKLKEKLQYYKDNQDEVTKKNIAKAQAEIAKLEGSNNKSVEDGVADLKVEDNAE